MRKTGRNSLLQRFQRFNLSEVPPKVRTKAENIFRKFTEDEVRKTSAGAASFFVWVSNSRAIEKGLCKSFDYIFYQYQNKTLMQILQCLELCQMSWNVYILISIEFRYHYIVFVQIQNVIKEPDPSPEPTTIQKPKKWWPTNCRITCVNKKGVQVHCHIRVLIMPNLPKIAQNLNTDDSIHCLF